VIVTCSQVISWHLPRETEETLIKPQVRIAMTWLKFQNTDVTTTPVGSVKIIYLIIFHTSACIFCLKFVLVNLVRTVYMVIDFKLLLYYFLGKVTKIRQKLNARTYFCNSRCTELFFKLLNFIRNVVIFTKKLLGEVSFICCTTISHTAY
jgi:hypothetical protein